MLFNAEQNRFESSCVNVNLLEKMRNINFIYDSPKEIAQQYILDSPV
jgi:hypothetical protein